MVIYVSRQEKCLPDRHLRSDLERPQDVPKTEHPPLIDCVVCPDATPRDGDQAGFAQHLEMMGNRWLSDFEARGDVANADGLALGRDQPKDL
jgi:hypothetical protein